MAQGTEELGALEHLAGAYTAFARGPYQLLCQTRRRCAYQRGIADLMFRKYPTIEVEYTEEE